ncbi:GD14167 [Drosophila simulans]|uniref:GD14167 n=1 Tax=Drosophila simulans TaxID=7240 RepID=B4QMR6_DROSI|nr:GD14167 [Drosophila simulans]
MHGPNDPEVHVDGKLVVISIRGWGGMPTRGKLEPLNLPVSKVIISETPPEMCKTQESCSYWARVTQSRHMDTFNWGQIGYNFLVGGDGRIYEGRGWNYMGAHTRDNNNNSIGISFLGTFRRQEPTQKSLEACQLLIAQDLDNIGGGLILRFVERQQWLAQPPQKEIPDLELPVRLVIALPTNSENCNTQAICVLRVRLLQSYDIESSQKCDISYNFLIGGDGNVYVGRGWDKMGAHMNNIPYDSMSLSFAYIGSFKTIQPSAKQLSVTRLLLERGVKLGKIAPNYRFTASSKLMPSVTDFKADALYKSFANWTHWS